MAGLVPAIHSAPARDRSGMSPRWQKAYWDKAFRSLLLAHAIRCAEHVDGRDKPGHDAFEAGAFPRNAPKIGPQPSRPQTRLHRFRRRQVIGEARSFVAP